MVNHYGLKAQDYWMKWLPDRYAALEDRTEFFEDLGEQIATQVETTSTALAGPDPENEDYLAKVARLTMAKRQAEELTLAELLYSNPPEPAAGSDDARAEWEADQPTEFALLDAQLRVEELRDQGYPEEQLQEILDAATPKPYPGDALTR